MKRLASSCALVLMIFASPSFAGEDCKRADLSPVQGTYKCLTTAANSSVSHSYRLQVERDRMTFTEVSADGAAVVAGSVRVVLDCTATLNDFAKALGTRLYVTAYEQEDGQVDESEDPRALKLTLTSTGALLLDGDLRIREDMNPRNPLNFDLEPYRACVRD